MATTPHKSTLDGLPKQFVNSLRVLFDILDEQKQGFIRLADIENRWQEGTVEGLPKGVIEALRKITPQSGKLSFERFVAGLKIALLRNKGDNGTRPLGSSTIESLGPRPDLLQNHVPPRPSSQSDGLLQPQRHLPTSSRKTTSASDVLGLSQSQKQHAPNTATVRPTNVMSQQRTKSLKDSPGT